ncbi:MULTISPECIES: excinuclease ABC subunit UvrC [Myxococcus]|uniref:UvrABC system protein C n=1 Tax=Myxococcus xanthus TaxID=34 RepID=A0AAE6FYV4_MYXXA|nr:MULTISPECIES: excinuclease ABC subunit UvrC [Myxococcus]QDE67767.1 excinuclease ABC subunit C [Myxococcus xanthus]QDE75044.1 excinuclease ABC subunit C [Myxococcus xanthus]QDE82316.1 excinuclease ABC subunit C [Myxococcus xanthus]WAM29067.1 excinuclease ABC subunit UvrC [Myxococcus sp. NMCA1]
MDAKLLEKLDALPTEPGVYLMKDRRGQVIYVGKAINLRSRVRSYFNRTGDTRVFVSLLDQLLGDLETVLVSNEKEALLLENELIKKHRPRFNVLLKDDKQFISLRLDRTQPYPRLEVVRKYERDGARYFGPYSSAGAIRETLRVVNRFFRLRTCTDHVLANRKRPCLLHQIGRCPAPCVYPVPQEDYHRSVDEVVMFLEGKAGELVEGLRLRMKRAAQELKFEEAARIRDQLSAIERSLERQKVATTDFKDQDVFAFHREGDRILFYVLWVRQGRLNGGQAFPFGSQEFPDEELIASFVNLYYDQGSFVPEEVLLPLELEDGTGGLEALLTERKGERVRVLVPKRGEKLDLVKMAAKNAEQAFVERRRTKDETDNVLSRLQQRLGLRNFPRRMECFDISHFQGSAIVASQVAVTDGDADKSRYRKYKIKTLEKQDDFASMYEVISRRLKRGLEDNDLPDLLVIDGGKGQLASAHAAMKDVGVDSVDVVGLAKSRDLEVFDRDAESARSPERVFVVGRKDPIVLSQNSAEMFMLTRMRDEAHRFAITFQKQVLRKSRVRSALEDIPGVGETRRKQLLRHFGSLKRVGDASIEELAEVVGPAMAERVHAGLHGHPEEDAEDPVREASLDDAHEPVDEKTQGGSPPGAA